MLVESVVAKLSHIRVDSASARSSNSSISSRWLSRIRRCRTVPPRVAVLFRQLRDELDKLLLQKLATPNLEFELAGRTIGTIVELLQEEEGVHQGQDAYS